MVLIFRSNWKHVSCILRKLRSTLAPTVVLLLLVSHCHSDVTHFGRESFARYSLARSNYLASPSSQTSAWHYARAIFDWAEFATNDTQRAALAEQGISVAEKVIVRDPESVGGHYYLAMNQGQLARTKTLGALRLVKDMEREFKLAAEIDPVFEYAGPDRSLGILYLEAPGWPTSIGNKAKARSHLQRAVKLVPNYPDNHLSLMEAYVRWEDADHLAEAIRNYRKILPKAGEDFAGPAFERDWSEWNRRWAAILKAWNELD